MAHAGQSESLDALARFLGGHAISWMLVIFLAAVGLILGVWRLYQAQRRAIGDAASGVGRRFTRSAVAERFRRRFPRAWTFLVNRFVPDSYLGLHLTVGLLVCVLGVLAFGQLADAIVDREELTRFDQTLADAVHQNGTLPRVAVFEAITSLGSFRSLGVVGVAVAVALVVGRRWMFLAGWVLTLVGDGLLNNALKNILHRPRPVFANPWVLEPDWSFPSGHAMGSLSAYGMLAYLLIAAWRLRFCRTIVSGTVALVLAIGFSRIYLGVHFFSDVLGSYAAATVWLAVCVTGCEAARRRLAVRAVADTVSKPSSAQD